MEIEINFKMLRANSEYYNIGCRVKNGSRETV